MRYFLRSKKLFYKAHSKNCKWSFFFLLLQSPDGDVIDCVLSHLQPAFDHPQLEGQKPLVLFSIFCLFLHKIYHKKIFHTKWLFQFHSPPGRYHQSGQKVLTLRIRWQRTFSYGQILEIHAQKEQFQSEERRKQMFYEQIQSRNLEGK